MLYLVPSPGPGSYEQADEAFYKYENSPTPKLPPRKSPSPRKTIDSRTGLLKEKYNVIETIGPLRYNTDFDPRDVRKVRTCTMGLRREHIDSVPTIRPDEPPGPGTYDTDAVGFGSAYNPMSIPLSKELHQNGNEQANILKRNGLTKAQYRIKQNLNRCYKSPYSFPKVAPPTSRYKSASSEKTSLW